MGHQANAHAGHEEDQVVASSEDACADSWAAVAIVTVVVLTVLFWLTGQ
jgi:hypothetical protein